MVAFRRPVQCMVAAAAVVLAAPSARAFVRETTGYTTGTPLARQSGCVVFAVVDPKSPTVSWEDLVSATTAAANSWTQASGGCGGGFRFEVAKAATSDSFGAEGDGVNAVILRASNYCNSKSAAPTCDPLSLAVPHLGQTMRGNIWVLFQCPPDGACYGSFPQPAWMRGNGNSLSHSVLNGGFRCARDDAPP